MAPTRQTHTIGFNKRELKAEAGWQPLRKPTQAVLLPVPLCSALAANRTSVVPLLLPPCPPLPSPRACPSPALLLPHLLASYLSALDLFFWHWGWPKCLSLEHMMGLVPQRVLSQLWKTNDWAVPQLSSWTASRHVQRSPPKCTVSAHMMQKYLIYTVTSYLHFDPHGLFLVFSEKRCLAPSQLEQVQYKDQALITRKAFGQREGGWSRPTFFFPFSSSALLVWRHMCVMEGCWV